MINESLLIFHVFVKYEVVKNLGDFEIEYLLWFTYVWQTLKMLLQQDSLID